MGLADFWVRVTVTVRFSGLNSANIFSQKDFKEAYKELYGMNQTNKLHGESQNYRLGLDVVKVSDKDCLINDFK